MQKKITVIGAGSWGTALSVLLEKNGHQVALWSCFQDEINMLQNEREHLTKLPGVKIGKNVFCTDDLEKAMNETLAVIMVVPSQTMRQNAKLIQPFCKKGQLIVSCSKGLEENSSIRLSEVIKQEITDCKVVVLSGPSHAEEVGKGIPTAVVAASGNLEDATLAQDIFMAQSFRVYTNEDVIGVELGGALKNSIAMCAGISDGLGFGDNTKAALMTRGMAEISRLGVSMGAKEITFGGLTGVGDLIVTCTSMHSRNRRAGILIGQGKTLTQALDEVKMVVEGVTTTKAAYELSRKQGVEMPITTEAFEILFNGKNARQAVVDLMTRDRKDEKGMN